MSSLFVGSGELDTLLDRYFTMVSCNPVPHFVSHFKDCSALALNALSFKLEVFGIPCFCSLFSSEVNLQVVESWVVFLYHISIHLHV